MELGQITLPRFPANVPTTAVGAGGVGGVGGNANHPNNQQNTNNSIFTMNNTYLMHLLCVIVKRLLKVAANNPADE